MIMKRVEFIDIAEIYKKSRVQILRDIDHHIDSINQQKDILRIIYHHIFYNACEQIRRQPSYIPHVVVYTADDKDILRYHDEFMCKEQPKRIFISLMRALPGYCYIYDGRYGHISDLDVSSGEYIEIVNDILSNRKKTTIQGAMSTTKSIGLTFVHQNYLKDPSIKLLYYK